MVYALSRKTHFNCGYAEYSDNEIVKHIGKNFMLKVFLQGELIEKSSMIVNLIDFKQVLHKSLQKFDHEFLNESITEFKNTNIDLQHIARYLFVDINQQMEQLHFENKFVLHKVELYENTNSWVEIYE
ncbi:MAG: hypothetical protein HOO06_06725 [Bdellovibrionaceae bacterium]|jgi:6-pyruvoyl-tetrahydropterin synthase|nr:hypothetical protein [Pseudobdellovibrionaceae bacterium]